MQETLVRFLGWQDPLEKEMATHCSILAWRISWTEEPGGLQSMGCKGLDTERLTFSLFSEAMAQLGTKATLVPFCSLRAQALRHWSSQFISFLFQIE